MTVSILALRFLSHAMTENKEMFSARLIPLAKSLIKAEAEAKHCSEAEIIEMWAFRHARSTQAKALLKAHASSDPLSNAVASVIREEPRTRWGVKSK